VHATVFWESLLERAVSATVSKHLVPHGQLVTQANAYVGLLLRQATSATLQNPAFELVCTAAAAPSPAMLCPAHSSTHPPTPHLPAQLVRGRGGWAQTEHERVGSFSRGFLGSLLSEAVVEAVKSAGTSPPSEEARAMASGGPAPGTAPAVHSGRERRRAGTDAGGAEPTPRQPQPDQPSSSSPRADTQARQEAMAEVCHVAAADDATPAADAVCETRQPPALEAETAEPRHAGSGSYTAVAAAAAAVANVENDGCGGAGGGGGDAVLSVSESDIAEAIDAMDDDELRTTCAHWGLPAGSSEAMRHSLRAHYQVHSTTAAAGTSQHPEPEPEPEP
jgi:hypothetical protein